MARKGIFAADPKLSSDNATGKLSADNSAQQGGPSLSRPAAKPALAFAQTGALAGLKGGLAHFTNHTKELEAKLTAGQTVVELDPAVVDASFVADRMDYASEAYEVLRASIEARGQETPILVRPHPENRARYQAAFGHSRLRVAKELGRPVRAVVKVLTDEELVVAQGQENNARADLSFIERARFAKSLENLGYHRTVIMIALAVDKAALSKMIAVTERIPMQVINAIGPARSMGRPRWLQLAEAFKAEPQPCGLDRLLSSDAFTGSTSDKRFSLVQEIFRGKKSADNSESMTHWVPPGGRNVLQIAKRGKSFVMTIDQEAVPGFADYLIAQLERLFGDYQAQQKGGE